jgi:hypothetical protein
MTQQLMLVLSNAKPDQDEEFNTCYKNVHVLDTINKLDGFASAQLFLLADLPQAPVIPYRYRAIYEIPDGQLDTAYAQFQWSRRQRAAALAEGREPLVPVSEAIDDETFRVGFFSGMTERIPASRDPASD